MFTADFEMEKFQLDLRHVEFIVVPTNDRVGQSSERNGSNVFHPLVKYVMLGREVGHLNNVIFPSIDFEVDLKVLADDNVTDFEYVNFSFLQVVHNEVFVDHIEADVNFAGSIGSVILHEDILMDCQLYLLLFLVYALLIRFAIDFVDHTS